MTFNIKLYIKNFQQNRKFIIFKTFKCLCKLKRQRNRKDKKRGKTLQKTGLHILR